MPGHPYLPGARPTFRQKGAYNINPALDLKSEIPPPKPPKPLEPTQPARSPWLLSTVQRTGNWLWTTINSAPTMRTDASSSPETSEVGPPTARPPELALPAQPEVGPLQAPPDALLHIAGGNVESNDPGTSSQEPPLAQSTASDGPVLKKYGHKKRRSPIENAINGHIRSLLEQHWLSSDGPPPRPSDADMKQFHSISHPNGRSRTRSSRIHVPIPESLHPDTIRFSQDRDYLGHNTVWNSAMAYHVVDTIVIPFLSTTVRLPAGQKVERKRLVKQVLARVYAVYDKIRETAEDRTVRLASRNLAQNRITLFYRRLKVAQEHPVFHHMIPLLMQIGFEGMSSDEEDVGDGHSRIHRRIHDHPWRAFAVTIALRALDQVALAVSNTQSKGNRPNVRTYRGPVASRRVGKEAMVATVVRGLPRNYYLWSQLEAWRHSLDSPGWTLEGWIKPQASEASTLSIPSLS